MRIRHVTVEGQTVTLREEGDRIDIVLGQVVLLSSAALDTERAFGALVSKLVPDARRVLVGGLGFGATVRGVLDACPAIEQIIVCEKVAAIEALCRGELAHISGDVLSDPRVTLSRGDVFDAYASEKALDAILLDVDNGPGWASFRTNARLYAQSGLEAAIASLSPSAIFAVWSGYPADAFLATLRKAGLEASVEPLLEKGILRARAYVGRVQGLRPRPHG